MEFPALNCSRHSPARGLYAPPALPLAAAPPDFLANLLLAIAIRGQALRRLRSLGGHGRKAWLSASGIFIPSLGFWLPRRE
jgi:hypothetical protein